MLILLNFRGEGSQKNSIQGGNCLKRGWGRLDFCRFKGDLEKKREGEEGVVFLMGEG